MAKILAKLKLIFVDRLYKKIVREIRYRRRLKELKKRDPFIY